MLCKVVSCAKEVSLWLLGEKLEIDLEGLEEYKYFLFWRLIW